ncbi:MAG TPA: aldo/keto reductase [Bacteroidota bacterium]|nr:aldo/keto reductase [Bacteroidota bacterium]
MKKQNKYTRREFFGTVIGTAAAAGVAGAVEPLVALSAGEGSGAQEKQGTQGKAGMPARPLGRMGHDVKIFSLGGQATLEEDGTEKESVEIVNRAIDLGVNYIDTAAMYGGGVSQKYIGQVMKTRRKEVFLATKTHSRSYDGSMRLLEESLKSLQTDHLDLWQLHNVRTQEDLDGIFAAGGAVRALEKARDQKMVRFLGITGHYDPFILKKAITQYAFDNILMALNAADKHNQSFIDTLLPTAVEKKMGIVGMKVPARGRMFREGGISSMDQAMRYVLTLPVSTIIVGIDDLKQLEENVRIAREFTPMTAGEMKKTEELTKPYYADASWFKVSW